MHICLTACLCVNRCGDLFSGEESCPILIQQNVDGSNANFIHRDWNSFLQEFGKSDHNSSYWIGLESLANLTSDGSCSLHVDVLEASTNRWYSAEYSFFIVRGISYLYRLDISGYSGNAGNAMLYHSGQAFSTFDRGMNSHCAQNYSGGFWYYMNGTKRALTRPLNTISIGPILSAICTTIPSSRRVECGSSVPIRPRLRPWNFSRPHRLIEIV